MSGAVVRGGKKRKTSRAADRTVRGTYISTVSGSAIYSEGRVATTSRNGFSVCRPLGVSWIVFPFAVTRLSSLVYPPLGVAPANFLWFGFSSLHCDELRRRVCRVLLATFLWWVPSSEHHLAVRPCRRPLDSDGDERTDHRCLC